MAWKWFMLDLVVHFQLTKEFSRLELRILRKKKDFAKNQFVTRVVRINFRSYTLLIGQRLLVSRSHFWWITGFTGRGNVSFCVCYEKLFYSSNIQQEQRHETLFIEFCDVDCYIFDFEWFPLEFLILDICCWETLKIF